MRVELGDEIGEADRVVVEHGDVAGRLIGDVHLVPWSTRRMSVPPMEITSSSGCGEKMSTRFGKDARRANAVRSPGCLACAGLPPGQPVIVACRWRKTLTLMSYAGPRSASRSCRPSSL